MKGLRQPNDKNCYDHVDTVPDPRIDSHDGDKYDSAIRLNSIQFYVMRDIKLFDKVQS